MEGRGGEGRGGKGGKRKKNREGVLGERQRDRDRERKGTSQAEAGEKEQGEARWEKVRMCFCDPNLPCFPHSPLHGGDMLGISSPTAP